MLKSLKAKRNQLIADLEVMTSAVEVEKRALSNEEIDAFKAKKEEIEKIDETIELVQEQRMAAMSKEEQKVEKEVRSAEEMEKRAMDAFFRNEDMSPEMRTMLASTSTNQATFPLTIAKGILKKLEEICPVLERAKRFSSKGTLRLINETSYGDAAIKEENQEFADADAVLGHIDLSAYKVTAMTKATFELLANSSVDLDQYLTDVIVRRLGKELNKLFVVGTGTKQAEGLAKGKQTVEIQETITYDDAVKMITSMHPDYLTDAVFIMNRTTFGAFALLEDGNGHKYIQNGVVNGKFTYTLAGIPIIIDNNMQDLGTSSNRPIILANIGEAYSINMLQDIVVRRLDQVEFTNGVEVFAGYLMADGKITNQDALRVAVVAS